MGPTVWLIYSYFALLDNSSCMDSCTPEISALPHLASTSLNRQKQYNNAVLRERRRRSKRPSTFGRYQQVRCDDLLCLDAEWPNSRGADVVSQPHTHIPIQSIWHIPIQSIWRMVNCEPYKIAHDPGSPTRTSHSDHYHPYSAISQ